MVILYIFELSTFIELTWPILLPGGIAFVVGIIGVVTMLRTKNRFARQIQGPLWLLAVAVVLLWALQNPWGGEF